MRFELMGTIHLNKESFAARVSDVLESGQWKYLGDKPAIIDFFATWCGPCQALAPTLDAAAERFADQIYVYKVDVDEEPELASLFNIRSIPTLLFVPMQGKPKINVGLMSKSDIDFAVKNVLLQK